MEDLNISNSEMVVMRVIWSLGNAKVEEVMQQISNRRNWSTATVKTLLGRLVKKDILETEKDGRCFVYRAKVGEEEAIRLLTQELLMKICATKHALAISDAVELSMLTKEDIALLIEKLKGTTPVESTRCSCLDDDENCRCMHQKQKGEDKMLKTTYKIEGMTCEHCAKHVTAALENVSGVQSAKVSLKENEAVVKVADTVAIDNLKAAVAQAGYKLV